MITRPCCSAGTYACAFSKGSRRVMHRCNIFQKNFCKDLAGQFHFGSRTSFEVSKMVEVPEGYKLIFRTTKVDPRTGKVLYARNYGLRAWPILIPA